MLHGRARQRWSFASNMIEEDMSVCASDMQSVFSNSKQMYLLVVFHEAQKLCCLMC